MQRQALLLSGLLALVAGCVVQVPAVLDAGEGDDAETGVGPDGDDGEMSDTGDDPIAAVPGPEPDPGPTDGDGCVESLDILVVMDNSGSMGGDQAQTTHSLPLLLDGLDLLDVDWRLAVTTTDNGNMWCPVDQ